MQSSADEAAIRIRAATASNSSQLTTADDDVSSRTFLATDVVWEPPQWNQTLSELQQSPDLRE